MDDVIRRLSILEATNQSWKKFNNIRVGIFDEGRGGEIHPETKTLTISQISSLMERGYKTDRAYCPPRPFIRNHEEDLKRAVIENLKICKEKIKRLFERTGKKRNIEGRKLWQFLMDVGLEVTTLIRADLLTNGNGLAPITNRRQKQRESIAEAVGGSPFNPPLVFTYSLYNAIQWKIGDTYYSPDEEGDSIFYEFPTSTNIVEEVPQIQSYSSDYEELMNLGMID